MNDSAHTVFAPATVANLAVGFDLLGLSIGIVGDEVTVERITRREVVIGEVAGVVVELPADPRRNTATAGLVRLIEERHLSFGFRVSIRKGIPLGSGMGGSAASAVGAIVAASDLLDEPLSLEEMARYALIGESVASGSAHADNIAPCLYGGLTLANVGAGIGTDTDVDTNFDVDVISIPVPAGLHCVLVHPHLRIETHAARAMLKPDVRLRDHVRQSAHLAGFLAACYTGDLVRLGRSMSDIVIEPQRSRLIPGFAEVQGAALGAGALGCSISGSGPSLFALASDEPTAVSIRGAMVEAFARGGTKVDSWVVPLPCPGARRLVTSE